MPPASIAEEFVGLDYFSLTPFFILAGATVTPDAHTHGDDVHVTGVVVSIPRSSRQGFLATLPEFLADAYGVGGLSASSQPGSASIRASSAVTTCGSNWVPEQRRSSSHRGRDRHRLAVGAGRGHGVEGVADGHDPRRERDLLARQPVRVAAAVVALVRGAHDEPDRPEQPADAVEHLLALDRVGLHHAPTPRRRAGRAC